MVGPVFVSGCLAMSKRKKFECFQVNMMHVLGCDMFHA